MGEAWQSEKEKIYILKVDKKNLLPQRIQGRDKIETDKKTDKKTSYTY